MKKYAGLIIILVIPLIIICVYSFSTLDFSGLRKANISSCFRPLTEIPADTAVSEEIKADTAICDTSRQRILFIGDSMLEGLGKRMKYYAGENGHELQYVIWYSSTTKTWAEHIDTISYLINNFKPTYIFICLGANELYVRKLDARNEYVKTIISRFDDIPYIWIGPPNWREDTGINDIILKNVGEKSFFPSKELTFDRQSDGAHPTLASAAVWMDSVAVFIREKTNHPILMNLPQPGASPAGRFIVWKPMR